MNCIFCHKPCNYKIGPESDKYFWLKCFNCKSTFYLIDNNIVEISFPGNEDYRINLQISSSTCTVYHRFSTIVKVNYLPFIQPDTANEWLNRLLKLTVFS